jgi:hypothetical protein
MIRSRYKRVFRTVLEIGLLLAATGCSNRQPEDAPLLGAISKTVGFTLPADATTLAYQHQHEGKDASQCSQLWIVRASSPLSGPDRRSKQSRAKSPFKSLQLLVEQATDGRVAIEAADQTACECVEWSCGENICRLRQAKTSDGWVAVLEAVTPQ